MNPITDSVVKLCKETHDFGLGTCTFYSLQKLQEQGFINLDKLPYSIRILLENVLRNYDDHLVPLESINAVASWPTEINKADIAYMPSRVILQDFTGVPLIVDLANMRDAMKKNNGDPTKINPIIPTDLVIDHSVQVDFYGANNSLLLNLEKEFGRNNERYKLIKWAQESFQNFRVVPPGSGIVHQVNLEYLASVIHNRDFHGEKTAFPDTVVGTDSHTTMVAGLGVMAWGVGGIEAEAVMLGQPYTLLLPEVIGVKLIGELPEGATATDLVLTVTELLRKTGVVEKFVEFFGPGVSKLPVPDRATISNMSPEYGATMGYFPIDDASLAYLQFTGRDSKHIEFVKNFSHYQHLFRTDTAPDPIYTKVITLDMSTVEPSVSGPANPEERVSLPNLKPRINEYIDMHAKNRKPIITVSTSSIGKPSESASTSTPHPIVTFELDGKKVELKDADLVIAAITSCTNTSNPSVMVGAGLLAKKAVERGLKVKPYVKTSLAPGSKVVTDYLKNLGLDKFLNDLGFNLVGYGCTTCIGNSGPLKPAIENVIKTNDLYVTSILSGNRNFSGRIHQLIRGNFLASPILVVAYALAGTTNIDITKDPLGNGKNGKAVYLKDIWPSQKEIRTAIEQGLKPEMYKNEYSNILDGDFTWQALETAKSTLYKWEPESTYVREPPYFDNYSPGLQSLQDIHGAKVLILGGDKISTDHISPAGEIAVDSPAGKYLLEHNVNQDDFNTYGSRRGNHEVMIRGTFANVRFRNQFTNNKEGWWTTYIPTGELITTYDASIKYRKANIPLIILGGAQYGQGSSRDWAAKGPMLLGAKAVIVKNFERIHRSNLIGMGVLPLEFEKGKGWKELGLDGTETYDIIGLNDKLIPKQQLTVIATRKNGQKIEFKVIVRLDSKVEINYYHYGGILPYVVSKLLE